jgi:urease accessory protein
MDNSAGEAGISGWNGMLVARLIAPGGQALRADLVRLIECLRGLPMPRVWNC